MCVVSHIYSENKSPLWIHHEKRNIWLKLSCGFANLSQPNLYMNQQNSNGLQSKSNDSNQLVTNPIRIIGLLEW